MFVFLQISFDNWSKNVFQVLFWRLFECCFENFLEKLRNTVKYTVLIACERVFTFCLRYCSFLVLLVVANNCPHHYMMEFAKVITVVHRRVRADLPETSWRWLWTIWLHSPMHCATTRKCFHFRELHFFASLRAALCTVNMTSISSKMAKSKTAVCLVFLGPWCDRILVVLAPLEAVTASWSVQSKQVRGRGDDTGGWQGLDSLSVQARTPRWARYRETFPQHTCDGTRIQRHLVKKIPLCVCLNTRASVAKWILSALRACESWTIGNPGRLAHQTFRSHKCSCVRVACFPSSFTSAQVTKFVTSTPHMSLFSYTARTISDVWYHIGSSVCARHPIRVLSDCLLSLRSSLCSLYCLFLSSTSSAARTLNSTFPSSMWMSSEQDPLCTSPNEEFGPLANNAPLTGFQPKLFDDFHYSETAEIIFQEESGDKDAVPSYLFDAELDDETIGKALSSPLFIHQREEPADRRQADHSFEESLLPSQSLSVCHVRTGRPYMNLVR